jgi:hypothetical protein
MLQLSSYLTTATGAKLRLLTYSGACEKTAGEHNDAAHPHQKRTSQYKPQTSRSLTEQLWMAAPDCSLSGVG